MWLSGLIEKPPKRFVICFLLRFLSSPLPLGIFFFRALLRSYAFLIPFDFFLPLRIAFRPRRSVDGETFDHQAYRAVKSLPAAVPREPSSSCCGSSLSPPSRSLVKSHHALVALPALPQACLPAPPLSAAAVKTIVLAAAVLNT